MFKVSLKFKKIGKLKSWTSLANLLTSCPSITCVLHFVQPWPSGAGSGLNPGSGECFKAKLFYPSTLSSINWMVCTGKILGKHDTAAVAAAAGHICSNGLCTRKSVWFGFPPCFFRALESNFPYRPHPGNCAWYIKQQQIIIRHATAIEDTLNSFFVLAKGWNRQVAVLQTSSNKLRIINFKLRLLARYTVQDMHCFS